MKDINDRGNCGGCENYLYYLLNFSVHLKLKKTTAYIYFFKEKQVLLHASAPPNTLTNNTSSQEVTASLHK